MSDSFPETKDYTKKQFILRAQMYAQISANLLKDDLAYGKQFAFLDSIAFFLDVAKCATLDALGKEESGKETQDNG